ncbi:MAG: peptidylprolyl isomerase [Bacteroidota bacterium]
MKSKLFVALFFSAASVLCAQNVMLDRVIAVVGDKPILYSEMEAQYLQAKNQGVPMGDNPYALILDQLLYQKLLLHNAEIDSLEVSEDQVQNELEARIRYYEQMIPGGRKGLEEFYGKPIAQIKEEFYDNIKENLLAKQMERQVTSGIKVTPAEIREFFNKIPKDSLPLISSMLEMAQIVKLPKITEETKTARRTELEELRQRLLKGEISWCRAALKSDDPGTRTKCGEWGEYVTMGAAFVPEFDAMARKMKPKTISEIFETPYGYHFMRLDDRRGEEYIGAHILFTIQPDDEELLKASQQLDSVMNMLNENAISFEDAVKKFSDDEEGRESGGKIVNPQNGDTRFEISSLDPEMFMTVDKMKPGEISGIIPYSTRDGKPGMRIIKLLKRSDPHRANLTDDYQMISEAAQADKEEKTVEKWVSSKISTTYIWIADEYKNYSFQYKWIKEK